MKELLSITSLEDLSVNSLHDAFVKLVEIPFNERLMRLFQFVDSNADAELTYQEVLRLFSLLYWQESCCFVTGELCSSQGYLLFSSSHHSAYFLQQGQSISTRFITDFLIQDKCSFDPILFWLMNRGNSIFSPSYYSFPSEIPRQEAFTPRELQPMKRNQDIEANMEFVYLASSLYQKIVATHPPVKSFIDCVSGYVNDENEVTDEDLVCVLNSFFGVKEEEDSKFGSNLKDLCDLVTTLFHVDEQDVCLF